MQYLVNTFEVCGIIISVFLTGIIVLRSLSAIRNEFLNLIMRRQ